MKETVKRIGRSYFIIVLLCLISSVARGQENKFEPKGIDREDGFYETVNYDSAMPNLEIELKQQPALTIEHIKTVETIIGQFTNQPEIAIGLTKNGAEIFRKLTKKNIGKPIAIVLDRQIVYQPLVQSEITGGRLIISGNFSLEVVSHMVRRLQGK